MRLLVGLLKNSSFIFTLAMILGLVFGDAVSHIESVLVPVLAIIMTISIIDISSRIFLDLRKIMFPVVITLLLSYVVLSGTYIGLSALMIDDYRLHSGFILLAAVPPAVAAIPTTYLLGGNTRFSLIGDAAAYAAALAVTPAICLIFLGSNIIEPTGLLITLAEMIVVPIIVSRIIRRTRMAEVVIKWRNPVVNWGFFIVIFAIIGLNRRAFLQEPSTLLLMSIIAFISTFVLTELINRIARAMGVSKEDRISLFMLGTRKNTGFAGAIAIIFLSSRAAIPVAVVSAFSIIHLIWLTWWVKRMR